MHQETSYCEVIETQHPAGHTHRHHKGMRVFLELCSWEINTSKIQERSARRYKHSSTRAHTQQQQR